jgi:hypothetical protein
MEASRTTIKYDVENTYEELISAFNDMNLLPQWLISHDVNSDVIVPADSTCKCQASGKDNRGSPLLIAVELDLSLVCAVLIANGANVNYRHPSDHGNAPFLRAAEMGLTECLEIILAQPSLDHGMVTREYKLVLGQNIPQYEAGGRSALILAIESLQPTAVAMLLAHDVARGQLLDMFDSFGRSPLQAAWEVVFMREQGTEARSLAEQSCRLLCTASNTNYCTAFAEQQILGLDRAEAKARLRYRNVELRSRYLTISYHRREEEKQAGLSQWRKHYWEAGRALHPEVYRTSFAAADLLLSPQAGVTVIPGRVQDSCCVSRDTHPPPVAVAGAAEGAGPTATLDPSQQAHSSVIYEPLPGTFVFPLLSPSLSAAIYAELEHYETTARTQPELSLPLHVRHDGNLGQLESCGFEPLLKAIEKIWQSLVRELMPLKGECEVYHAFLTRNWVDRDENATFKRHCDKSDLTFNICLQASEGFQGSTVGFFSDPDGLGSAGRTPVEDDRVYTHRHRIGHAVMHDGSQWHVTDPITKGTRASLIVWARRVGAPCVQCGAAMGSTWLFCKECGKEVLG